MNSSKQLSQEIYMKFERTKAVNNALAEINNGLHTFYYGDNGYEELRRIETMLKEFKDTFIS